jgi:outer membrane usher protein FimD/PapC
MKLKELMSKVVENKKNGQLNTCLKKNQLKKVGISKDELLDMNVDIKLKKILFED